MRTMLAAVLVGGVLGCVGPEPDVAATGAAIYHGTRESGEEWVVAVSYPRPGTTRIRLCTGSVIAPRVVLTAKHCVFDEVSDGVWEALDPSVLTVRVTDDYTAGTGDERGVIAVRTTPGVYTRTGAMNGDDIALLTLDGDLGVPAMPYARTPPVTGADVRILGFGFTERDELGVKYAATAQIAEVGDGVFESTGSAWTCTGDSGGPALDVASGALAGVTSYGPSSCSTPASFYTRVDRHAAMIDEVLGVAPPPPGDDAGPMPAVDGGSPVPGTDAGGPPPMMMRRGGGRDGGCAATGWRGTAPLPSLLALALACALLLSRKGRV